jgi:hypothetical protein
MFDFQASPMVMTGKNIIDWLPNGSFFQGDFQACKVWCLFLEKRQYLGVADSCNWPKAANFYTEQ